MSFATSHSEMEQRKGGLFFAALRRRHEDSGELGKRGLCVC